MGEGDQKQQQSKKRRARNFIIAVGNWIDPAKGCEDHIECTLKLFHQKDGRLETPAPLGEGRINSLALSY